MNDKYMNPLHSPHLQAAIQLRKNGYTADIEDIADQLEEESVSNPNIVLLYIKHHQKRKQFCC